MTNRGFIKTANTKIGLILLAAGASVRLGNSPKQLLDFHGKTLIRHSAETALAVGCDYTVAVLGANAELIKKEIEDLHVEIIVNEDWENGMSSSIKSGLKHLLNVAPHLSAVCLYLCDQPLITSDILKNLLKVFHRTNNKIIASKYEETFGVPALFEKSLFDELLNLNNQTGAKKLIEKYKSDSGFIHIPEAAFDVDTMEDYERLKSITSFNPQGY